MAGTGPQNQPDEALVDLLIKQVTEGLSAAEQRELDVLDSETASALARDFERAAAAVTLAGTPSGDVLPPALAQRIEADARAFFASAASAGAPGNVVELQAARDAQAEPRPAPRRASLGWWAAAACLMLAVWGWLRSPPAPPLASEPVVVAPPVVTTPKIEPKPPTPAEAREAMLARPDALKVTIGATKEPAAAGMSADVVWDPATQKGYLHVSGLARNDPKLHQYQLWIFDGQRDQRYPVDGGVFDMPENSSEVVLPIRAALLVHDAKAFAVTIEKPGGAVVSARDHVVGLGKAG
jgi:hypothetical protein